MTGFGMEAWDGATDVEWRGRAGAQNAAAKDVFSIFVRGT